MRPCWYGTDQDVHRQILEEQHANEAVEPASSILPAMLQHYDRYATEGRCKVRVIHLGELWITDT